MPYSAYFVIIFCSVFALFLIWTAYDREIKAFLERWKKMTSGQKLDRMMKGGFLVIVFAFIGLLGITAACSYSQIGFQATAKPKPKPPTHQAVDIPSYDEVIGTATKVEEVIERGPNRKLVRLTLVHFAHDEGHDEVLCMHPNTQPWPESGGHYIMQVHATEKHLGYPMILEVVQCDLRLSENQSGIKIEVD